MNWRHHLSSKLLSIQNGHDQGGSAVKSRAEQSTVNFRLPCFYPLLRNGCHDLTYIRYYVPMGYLFFFLNKKTNQTEGICSFTCAKWKYSPVYYPQEKKAPSLSTSSWVFFFIIIPFSTHCLVTCLCQTFALAIRHYPIWQFLVVSHTISSDMIRSCTWRIQDLALMMPQQPTQFYLAPAVDLREDVTSSAWSLQAYGSC